MQHSALSYLILPFTFFFFLMNSTLHQCAAEISTKAVQVCAYCSGELNVYIFIVDGCLSLCLACMHTCTSVVKTLHTSSLLPQSKASPCGLVNSCCHLRSQTFCGFCVCLCAYIITVCFAQKVESYLPWSNIKNNYFGLS